MRAFDLNTPFDGITTCDVHSPMDDTCEACKHEHKAKQFVIERMGEMAQERATALAGTGAPMPNLQAIRLETLIESLLHDRNRLHYETEVGRRCIVELDEAKATADRMRLVHPGYGKPGLQVVKSGSPLGTPFKKQ